jgi:hypothetical protein
MNATSTSTSTPSSAAASGIEAIVCADIARRQSMGVAKYGTTVQDNPLPLRAWLAHAYEETLDTAIYLRRAMHEIDQAPVGAKQDDKAFGHDAYDRLLAGEDWQPHEPPADKQPDSWMFRLALWVFLPLGLIGLGVAIAPVLVTVVGAMLP